MEKLIDCNTYPANVLSAIFGAQEGNFAYYCDSERLEKTVCDMMQFHFTAEDCTVFFSLYKERKPISEIAEALQCSDETVQYMHYRILRTVRFPKFSKRLKDFTQVVRIEGTCVRGEEEIESPMEMEEILDGND